MSRLSAYAPYAVNYCRIVGRKVRTASVMCANSQFWYDLAGELLAELKAKLPAAEFEKFMDDITEDVTNREAAERAAALLGWDVTPIF